MQHVAAAPLLYEFSRHVPPRARIAPGETICVESDDAFSGQIRTPGDRRDRSTMPLSNPVAGPIWVEGAEPGDALAVTIDDIRPRDGQCATYTAPPRALTEWLGDDTPHGAHVCPIRDRFIYWREDLRIPYAPMLGCIGTTPSLGVPTTGPSGPHGGNMDLVEVRPGSTIHLPVFLEGGLLYLGDAHAAQGHGELSGSGLEMAAESTVRVDLIKQANLPAPRIITPDELVAVGLGGSVDRALAHGFAMLILWLEAEHGWDRWQAYDLLTHTARVSLGYVAGGTVGVAIPRSLVQRSS